MILKIKYAISIVFSILSNWNRNIRHFSGYTLLLRDLYLSHIFHSR